MKTIQTILASLATLALLAGTAQADAVKGQKLYLKKLKSKCQMNGAKMASQHTQDEWEEFNEDGTLSDELIRLCPAGEKIIGNDDFRENVIPHVYDFLYEYGSDSGNVPSC